MSGKKGEQSDFKFSFGGDASGAKESAQKTDKNVLESLPRSIQEKVAVLKSIQDEKEKIDEDFQKELRSLEVKYEKLFQPFYEKREKIVTGQADPTPQELETCKEYLPTSEEGKTVEQQPETGEKGIPLFWTTTLLHSDFAQLITEKDEEILQHLLNVTSKSVGEGPSFEVVFTFAPNPFFSETVLRKVYNLSDEGHANVLNDVEPAKITWAAGKNPMIKKVTKKVSGNKRGGRGRGGKQGGQRTVTVEEACDSFFHFFDPAQTPLTIFQDEEEEEGFEPEDITLEEIMEQDYDYGMRLKDQIIPNAILYYTGEVDTDMLGLEDDEGEDDGEEGEEGESEDDEDFDPSTAPPAAKPEDCKQQ